MLVALIARSGMGEATHDKHIRELKIQEAVVNATAYDINEMALEGMLIKCISEDGAGEHKRSVKFQHVLADWRIRCRGSPPNGTSDRATQ